MVAIPKVSVIIPVYNTGKYVSQCLESVCNQTFTDFEVVIIDDGSQDNSLEIVREFSRHDQRIKVYPNNTNKGVCYSLNRALQQAKAPFIARADSDDIMVDDRLEKQYAYFQAHPECIVLGGQVIYINEHQGMVGNSRFPLSDKKIKRNLFYFQSIADCTVMFNRELIPEKERYFNEDLILAEGLDFYFRLVAYGEFANISDSLVFYRQRSGSLLTTDLKRTIRYISQVRFNATNKYGVKAPYGARIITLIQKILIVIFPFSIVVKLYDLAKRILIKFN